METPHYAEKIVWDLRLRANYGCLNLIWPLWIPNFVMVPFLLKFRKENKYKYIIVHVLGPILLINY